MVIKLEPELDYSCKFGCKSHQITLGPGEFRFREYGYARKPSE